MGCSNKNSTAELLRYCNAHINAVLPSTSLLLTSTPLARSFDRRFDIVSRFPKSRFPWRQCRIKVESILTLRLGLEDWSGETSYRSEKVKVGEQEVNCWPPARSANLWELMSKSSILSIGINLQMILLLSECKISFERLCRHQKQKKNSPESNWLTAKPVNDMILFERASLCFHSRSSWSTTERKGRSQNMRWLCFVAWLQLSLTSYTTHNPPDLWTLPTSNGKCFKANVKHYHNFDNIHLLSESRFVDFMRHLTSQWWWRWS